MANDNSAHEHDSAGDDLVEEANGHLVRTAASQFAKQHLSGERLDTARKLAGGIAAINHASEENYKAKSRGERAPKHATPEVSPPSLGRG